MKYIFITGVNRGIGFFLTKELLKRGHSIVGTYRKASDNNNLQKLKSAFPKTLNLTYLDVTAVEKDALHARHHPAAAGRNHFALSGHVPAGFCLAWTILFLLIKLQPTARAYRIIPLCTRGRSICLQQTEPIASQAVSYYCFIPRPPAPCALPAPDGPGSAPAALAPYLPLGHLQNWQAHPPTSGLPRR